MKKKGENMKDKSYYKQISNDFLEREKERK